MSVVAEHLLMHGNLDCDYLDVLVDSADNECTDEEWQTYFLLRKDTVSQAESSFT